MLKALELVGFKSFADKTRFDFPAGITVVVGPNGSGKSNIVDGIKWVLGEQSAKSLRGKDMSDVIFKGTSGPGGRRPSGAAEATIIIDNTQKHFDIDSDEIHVSRRVYRSGESEYLINGAPSRLKDIRNMFRGTGVGTDAYSLIEQGKVERMLQASPKDRRAIFEEAAGISRFNAKKVEAQRRLARVDQHLIRLADIVEEVGSRYRSIKSQASKAARYKEYTTRLKELRTFVGAADWREFQETLTKLETEKSEQNGVAETEQAAIDSMESENREIEQKLDELNAGVSKKQESVTTVREKIANLQSELKNNRERLLEFDNRDQRLREGLEKFAERIQPLRQTQSNFQSALEQAANEKLEKENDLAKAQNETDQLLQDLSQLQQQVESDRRGHSETIALVAELEKQISVANSQLKTTEQNQKRIEKSLESAQLGLATAEEELQKANSEIQVLNDLADSKDTALAEARKQHAENRKALSDAREQLGEFTSNRAVAEQKLELIQELEQNLEGINSGPRSLLQLAKTESAAPYDEIVGLVADLVQVNVQHATLVDIALGPYAQYIVVNGDNLIRAVADEKINFTGRVGMIQLSNPKPIGALHEENLAGINGVIGRVDELVQTQPEYEVFVKTLLRGTWLVKQLSDALHLRKTRDSKARFVTLDGEVLESDGTIVAGPQNVASGIVSRRSELRALTREIKTLEQSAVDSATAVETMTEREQQSESEVQSLLAENTEIAGKIREQQSFAKSTEKQTVKLKQILETAEQERADFAQQLSELNERIEADQKHLDENRSQIETLSKNLDDAESRIQQIQLLRDEHEKTMTSAKVELARYSQRVQQLESENQSASLQIDDLSTSIVQDRSDLASVLWGRRQSARVVREADIELESATAIRDDLEQQLDSVASDREAMETRRKSFRTDLNQHRNRLKKATEESHRISLEQEKLNLNLEQLRQRILDDYGIEVADLEQSDAELTDEEVRQREEIDIEIKDLRQKISNIGSVNMDALKELEETEGRYNEMHEQYTDLVNAKEELEKIIQRINNDSRRLFAETLEAIRLNFQQLFRQTFGGGRADIILEEGVDVLEAGIEIVATPPGKPQFNNSLLSGGEKALTAVSLLMAIFKFRPSPFCVLDEVDAPFDEANIGRFIDVLKSFLGWTKFVIVTHSKKTMTAATTLYGVTMQESGISKRVSVRFEEVGEHGEIAESAVERTIEEEGQEGAA